MTLNTEVVSILVITSVNLLASIAATAYAALERRKKNSEKIDELLEWKRSYDDCEWRSGKGVKQWIERYEPLLEKLRKDHG